MHINPVEKTGLLLINPVKHGDSRGYLSETFRKEYIEKYFKTKLPEFCQENKVHSKKGVLRGLHYQLPPYAQSKLITVLKGRVYDVVIDLRKWSGTFGRVFEFQLTDSKDSSLYIPRGFAHGFLTLSKESVLLYKLDNYYHPTSGASIAFDDIELDINWPMDPKSIIASRSDKTSKGFSEAPLFYDQSAI